MSCCGKGKYKINFVEHDPPQVFDMVADPDELHDLASDPAHQGVTAGAARRSGPRNGISRA